MMVKMSEFGETYVDDKKIYLKYEDLVDHFSDDANTHLYDKREDGSIVCRIDDCDFEIFGDSIFMHGSRGDRIVFKDGEVYIEH